MWYKGIDMGSSHYWTSLWGLLLFICLGLFCLMAVGAVAGFFSDRLGVLSLWHSPLWLRYKTPIIVVGVIIGLVTLVALIRYQGIREEQRVREYAEKQGWGFSREVPQEISATVSNIVSDLEIDLHFARRAGTGSRQIWLFDCSYRNKEASARKSYTYGIACLIRSNRFQSIETPVTIEFRDWTEIMSSDKVGMGQSPFAEKFLVLSRDAETARRVVNEPIQSVMLQYLADEDTGRVSVTLGNREAVLLAGRVSEQEQLQELIELARRIEEAAR